MSFVLADGHQRMDERLEDACASHSAGPTIGPHTEQVLRDILGYDDEKISGPS